MSQFSKDELSFVNKLPEQVEIKCPVCLNILVNPHLVSCCGHNFCESCIKRVKASNGACPMCNERSFQAMINKERLRIINGLQVYCPNRRRGFQWKGELKNLSTHLNKGKGEGECQYEEVKCRYKKCEERKQRQNLKPHEDNECLQRPFKCQYCNTRGTYCFITDEHYKICSKYPVPCLNKCTESLMPRDSVPAHLTKCPLQPVDCVFSWAGCKERPLRKDIELHTTDTNHMMILAVACGELKKEIKELKDENIKLKQELIWATSHHLLPIEITHQFTFYSYESKVIHFYTSQQGYHMSAKIVRTFIVHELRATYTLLLALHEGMFDKCKPKLPKIFAKYKGRVIPLIEDTEATYEFIHGDTLNKVTSIYNIPSGVLTKELWTVYDNTVVVNVCIYT